MFKYEPHVHTSEASRCASASAAEQVKYYSKLGYTGICITDHFFNSNTTVPVKGLSWEERINMFYLGYEHACEAGKKYKIDVFFGFEFGFCPDLLVYNIDKQWLINHPDIDKEEIFEFCKLVHADGGFIVHAHPFREFSYMETPIVLLPKAVDAFEVLNANNAEEYDLRAKFFAQSYGLPFSAGSDNHCGRMRRLCGFESPERFENVASMCEAIRGGAIELFSKST